MSRTGKIARLPRALREQINRRLEDGESGVELVAWLNAQPRAKAVLKAEFGGRPVNEQNLTEWKQGGFLEWQQQEEELELARDVANHACTLAQVAKEPLSDIASPLLLAKYFLLVRNLNTVNMAEPESRKLLRAVCRDILDLRRGDHGAARLKLENEKLALVREQWKSEQREVARQRCAEARQNNPLTNEEKAARIADIFRMTPLVPQHSANQTKSN